MARLAALACALALGACTAPPPVGGPAPEVRVVAVVAPITDLVARVAGERGQVDSLVPPGLDSHTWEPTPAATRLLAEADLFVGNGLGLNEPALRLAEANLPDGAPIVLLAEEAVPEDEVIEDWEGTQPNPHVWMDPAYATAFARRIAEALSAVDPEGSAVYEENLAALLAQLEDLDTAIAAAIATVPEPNRKLVTYHDGWSYFARRYGMELVAAIQPADFSEPSGHEVRRIIDQIRAEQIPAVFGSEVFPSDVLAVIAEETGARYVAELADDELPGEPGDAEHSYIGMMVRNVRLMVEALGGDPEALA